MTTDIVLVEPDRDILEILVEILQEHGYSVAAFTDRAEAAKCVAETEGIRLLIVDIPPPFKDKLRRRSPTADAPVLLITATRVAAGDAEKILYKPFREDQFLDAVQSRATPVTRS